MKKVDTGKYNKDQKQYHALIRHMYEEYAGGVTLTPEYAYYVKNDLLRFLIRLARYKFVARLLHKTDSVLEVGSGSGLGSIFLAQHCRHVTGIDVKTTEVEEARSINSRDNVEFLVKDLYAFDPKRTFDAVIALDVIEHMPVKDGMKLVAHMARHLKPNGFLVLGTPSIYSYPYQGKLSQASHIKCYDQDELVSVVDRYFARTFSFSMNDEIVHTGNPKMAWYYFVLAYGQK